MLESELVILYEDNHIIVVLKPQNVACCPDESGDDNLFDCVKRYIKTTYEKPGNVFLGLVHRLDRPTGGVMVFAKTSKAAARLSEQMRTGGFEKLYFAVLCGCQSSKVKISGRFVGSEAKNVYLEQVTQPYPRAEGMRDAALLLVGLGRTQEARQLCADAIKLGIDGPIKSSVFLALGDSYYAEKNYREAAAHYGRTANIVSDKDLKPLSLYKIVCALKKDGKDGEALQYEENLRKEFPNWTPPERVRRMMEESSE